MSFFQDINQEFGSQRFQLHQASRWTDQAQRDKISLYGELELRNRLFHENLASDCHEIEELRRICCEETGGARQARFDENVFASREESDDSESVVGSDSGITEQSEFLVRCKRILRSWIREQLQSDTRSRSNFYCSKSQDLAALRFWIAAWYTEWYGYYRKRFWTTTCSRRTILYDLQQFKEFGVLLSGIETWYYRNGKDKRESEMKKWIVEYVDSITSLLK